MNKKQFFTLLLTILTGSLIVFSRYNYQQALSPGDHGRDLYAFEAATRGEVPYRDYWWVYGPLMPYYYGLFFKFLGTTIPSILIGKALLNLLGGIFVFLTLATVTTLPLAYVGALWFWTFNPGFFFTYNHAGAITALMWVIYMLFLYLRNQRLLYLLGGLLGTAALLFIKINFGLSSLVVFLFSIFLIDYLKGITVTRQKKMFYVFSVLILPPMVFTTYYSLVYDFPFYMLRQCFPYLKGDQQYYIGLGSGIASWFSALFSNIISSGPNLCFGIIVIISVFVTLRFIFVRSGDQNAKRTMLLALIIPGLFYLANLQELIRSGVTYRSHWSIPFSIILTFIVISQGTKNLNRIIQFMLLGAIAMVLQSTIIGQTQTIMVTKVPIQYFAHPRGQVYIGNDPRWIDTVQKTSDYLGTHLTKDETFFAFPYDPIYYYLTARKSPTRQLIFFNHINVPPEQEQAIIKELENAKVNYIVLSNRISSVDQSLGVFGTTYCPILKKYMDDHFTVIEHWGDWQGEPGWSWNYGTVILKRK